MARKNADATKESKIAAWEVVEKLNKLYKREVVTTANKKPPIRQIPIMNPAFDKVTEGGVLVNRLNEFWGENGSLKTYHLMLSVAAFQKAFPDKSCAVIDVEGTFDLSLAKSLGVDLKSLIYMQPDSLEQAVDSTQLLLSDPSVSLVGFDSMHAVGSAGEIEKSMEDDQMAINARFWNKAVRKFQSALNMNPDNIATLILINSAYSKVGFVMGNPEELKHGNQLKFAKSLSVNFRPLKEIQGDDPDTGEKCTIGRNIKIKTVKNKAGRPFLTSEFYFSYVPHANYGPATFDYIDQIVRLAIKLGYVKQAGAWVEYGEHKIQGIDNFVEIVREDVDIASKLEEDVYRYITAKRSL